MHIPQRIHTTHLSSALTSSSSALYSPQEQSNNISLYYIFPNNNNNNPQHTISLPPKCTHTPYLPQKQLTTHNSPISILTIVQNFSLSSTQRSISAHPPPPSSQSSPHSTQQKHSQHSTRAPFSASFVRTGADGECRRSARRRGTQQLPSAADE